MRNVIFTVVGCITKNLPDGAIELSGKIDETSGLAFFQNQFYTLNDSGGKAALYAFDKNGKLLEKHKIREQSTVIGKTLPR